MNNNRNNRRRGRGNRNQNSGGNQLNRIDSRARGNAPQLLDKYKKLAQDAQHNGDRVQAEYYLQFADHYFRVIADNKARQEEARAKRNENREQASDENEDGDEGDGRRNDNRRGNRRNRSRRSDNDALENEGDAGVEGEVADQEAHAASSPASESGDEEAERKPRRRRSAKPRQKAEEPSGEIDSSVLPPAIGDATGPGGEDGDELEAVG